MPRANTSVVPTAARQAVIGGAARHDVRSFRPHELVYVHDQEQGCFRHGYDRDLQLFVLWEGARGHQDRLLADLAATFTILSVERVRWSPEHAQSNFRRLYRTPGGLVEGMPEKVGDGVLTVIVVEDEDARYLVDRTVSGRVEPINEKVAACKRRCRQLVGGYQVHSTNSLKEFFEQAPLLLGSAGTERALEAGAWAGEIPEVERDAAGARGWGSLTDLFSFLGWTANYVVLRGFESLPDGIPAGEDLDLLCDDLEGLIASANLSAPGGPGRRHKGTVRVAGAEVRVDARCVGDGYLDPRWQADLLRRRTTGDGLVYRPDVEDLFFSLLYHVCVQKPAVPAHQLRLLHELAAQGFSPEIVARLTSDAGRVELLRGFLESTGYRYVRPDDRGVHVNRHVLRRLGGVRADDPPGRRIADTGLRVYRTLPSSWRASVPGGLKRSIRRGESR